MFYGAIGADAKEGGGGAGQFLDYGAGARALGMGGAFFSISDDASAPAFNPAGLAYVQRKEVSMMQATLFAQTKYNYIGYVHPKTSGGTFAVSLNQLVSSGFEKVEAKFNPATGEATSLTTMCTYYDTQSPNGVSWGKLVTDTMAFGTSVKQVKRQLDSSTDSALTLDIGFMKQTTPLIRTGVGIKNVFSKSTGDTDDKLPVTMKLGNSMRLFKDRLMFGMDLSKAQQGDMTWRFGGEFWATRWFPLRFGLVGTPTIQETDFGFGLNFKRFTLDIANGIHDLGASTRMSFTFKFGRSREETSGEKVKSLIQSGFEAFKDGNFQLAVLRLNQAFDADPSNMQVKAMLARLQTVVEFVPQAQGGEEIQTYVRKGAISYVDGRDLRTSINALRYAYNKNTKDEKLLSLLNLVEKEGGVAEVTRRPEGPEQFTFVDQKIYDARQAVYDGKYDLAIRRTQDVLDLEPNNITALEIMGSSFFLMEEKAKAKAVWKKVIELDPNNKTVAEFIKQVP
ncbi:MAG: UPF0164 family protein [Elusimicrobia bacterium]|nr:UPF0164 family protein [Elusimicrobiota bacterium]